MSRDKNAIKSVVVLAQILGTEGYSDHCHNEIKRWWNRNIMERGTRRRIDKLEREFSEFMADASEAERFMVGKFISLRARQSFDAAFRLGFQGFIHETPESPSGWAAAVKALEEMTSEDFHRYTSAAEFLRSRGPK